MTASAHTQSDSQPVSLVADACRFIENAASIPTLEILAHRASLSKHHFHRIFKTVTGLTPRQYAMAHRIKRTQAEIQQSASVTQAIFDAGYNSNGRFYESSNQVLGMTPTNYRKGGTNMKIHFAIGQCSLGAILVAQSERGICAIFLGDDPEVLACDLQDRFPQAELVGGNKSFEKVVAQVVGFVEAPQIGLDLPLDIRGTAFQQRVWQALRNIPPGKTTNYTELAKSIGAPKSARAVANACASNKIAVAIPCHRVVRTDGSLSGYRWGVARKRALLEKEKTG